MCEFYEGCPPLCGWTGTSLKFCDIYYMCIGIPTNQIRFVDLSIRVPCGPLPHLLLSLTITFVISASVFQLQSYTHQNKMNAIANHRRCSNSLAAQTSFFKFIF